MLSSSTTSRRDRWLRPATTVAAAACVVLALDGEARAAAKQVSCKPGQVRVTGSKGRSACLPLARLLPPPKDGDRRQLAVQRALTIAPVKTGSKAVARVSSVLGKRRASAARRKLLRSLGTLLTRADRGRKASAAQAGDCAKSPDFSDTTEDGALAVHGGVAEISTSAGGHKRITVTFNVGSCRKLELASCPTAAGVLDGKESYGRLDIHILIYEDRDLIYNQVVQSSERSTLHGQVAADAKLDTLEITTTTTEKLVSGGRAVAAHYLRNATITRTARVNMRTGAYDPSAATVNVIARVNGQSLGAESDRKTSSELAADNAPQFAATVARSIGAARSRETAFNQANTCAKIEWSPASNTLRLHQNDGGRVTATIRASDGAVAADGVTTVTSRVGGTIGPPTANGGAPALSYSGVVQGPAVLSAAVRATSTAGVATGQWSQPIEGPPPFPARISGTFHGHRTIDSQATGTEAWSGSATWQRSPTLDNGETSRTYTLVTGGWHSVVSGLAGNGCQVTGSQDFTMVPNATRANIRVFNPAANVVFPRAAWALPFDYFWETSPPSSFTIDVLYSSCPSDPDTTVSRSTLVSSGGINGVTTDGVTFAGTSSLGDGEVTWNFVGSG